MVISILTLLFFFCLLKEMIIASPWHFAFHLADSCDMAKWRMSRGAFMATEQMQIALILIPLGSLPLVPAEVMDGRGAAIPVCWKSIARGELTAD